MKTVWIISGLFLLLSLSCETTENPVVYKFVAAGHLYGNPMTYTSSVYPTCLNKLKELTKEEELDLLILMGDVVPSPTEENWEMVRAQLDSLAIKDWVVARGNHDISPYLDAHIQAEKSLAIRVENKLFLIINTCFPGWTVDSLQRNFLRSELSDLEQVEDIFVFSHQLWWLNHPPTNFELDTIPTNSFASFEGPSDFWQDAFPLFEDLEQPVYFFAGDIGCVPTVPGAYEDHFKNFHFYGSGMGGGIEDNFLLGQIFQDGTVKIERVNF